MKGHNHTSVKLGSFSTILIFGFGIIPLLCRLHGLGNVALASFS